MPRCKPPMRVEPQRTLLVASIARANIRARRSKSSRSRPLETMLGTHCISRPPDVPECPNDPPSGPPENPQSPRIPTPGNAQTVAGPRPSRFPPSGSPDRKCNPPLARWTSTASEGCSSADIPIAVFQACRPVLPLARACAHARVPSCRGHRSAARARGVRAPRAGADISRNDRGPDPRDEALRGRALGAPTGGRSGSPRHRPLRALAYATRRNRRSRR